MVRFYGSVVAALLAACSVPASAVVYTNSIAVEDVTLNIRIETDGTLGLIGIDNLVSFGGSVIDQNGVTYDFTTTYDFDPEFSVNFSYGPYLASANSFNLNGNYLATTDVYNENLLETLGIGGATYLVDSDEYLDGEFYLRWGTPQNPQFRQVRIPYAEFNQNIAFAAGAGAVPEPATWAMLVLGFGVIGSAARRRVSLRFA